MDNATLALLADPLRGGCPPPFFDQSQFGLDGCMYYTITNNYRTFS
jgi:hypothetical protein